MQKKQREDSEPLLNKIIKGLQEKKAHDIVFINIGEEMNSVTDYFVICHGTSKTQVDAVADSVVDVVRKEAGEKPWHIEGQENSEWILIDYVDIVIHIFEENRREFYKLEELWGDYEMQSVQE